MTTLDTDDGASVVLRVDCETEEESVTEALVDSDAVDVGADPDPLSDVDGVSLLDCASLLVMDASALSWT